MGAVNQYFWLFCGLWSGVGGGFLTWQRLQKKIEGGAFTREEVRLFALRQALWIFSPCFVFWLLQQSIGTAVSPEFLRWPHPQKLAAMALMIFFWGAMLYWIFLNDGAATLARYSSALSRSPKAWHMPVVFKALAIFAVTFGLVAIFSTGF